MTEQFDNTVVVALWSLLLIAIGFAAYHHDSQNAPAWTRYAGWLVGPLFFLAAVVTTFLYSKP